MERFSLRLSHDNVEAAIDNIKRAEYDLLLVPIFERFDDGDFEVIDRHFLSYAIRLLRIFNRNQGGKDENKDPLELADEIRSSLLETWSRETIADIKEHFDDQTLMVAEIAERVAYSLVLFADFVECTTDKLEFAASELCGSPEFLRWVCLFQADMNLAIKWLEENQLSDAGLIAVKNRRPLLFGLRHRQD